VIFVEDLQNLSILFILVNYKDQKMIFFSLYICVFISTFGDVIFNLIFKMDSFGRVTWAKNCSRDSFLVP
jgi:hypothetical protein